MTQNNPITFLVNREMTEYEVDYENKASSLVSPWVFNGFSWTYTDTGLPISKIGDYTITFESDVFNKWLHENTPLSINNMKNGLEERMVMIMTYFTNRWPQLKNIGYSTSEQHNPLDEIENIFYTDTREYILYTLGLIKNRNDVIVGDSIYISLKLKFSDKYNLFNTTLDDTPDTYTNIRLNEFNIRINII